MRAPSAIPTAHFAMEESEYGLLEAWRKEYSEPSVAYSIHSHRFSSAETGHADEQCFVGGRWCGVKTC